MSDINAFPKRLWDSLFAEAKAANHRSRPGDERVDEVDRWSTYGVLRRDCEPERGTVLLLLGAVSMMLGIISCLAIPALLALPIGLYVYATATQDLRQMRQGMRDSRNSARTDSARRLALVGVAGGTSWWLLSLLLVLVCLLGA
jgi:hypothetical protein